MWLPPRDPLQRAGRWGWGGETVETPDKHDLNQVTRGTPAVMSHGHGSTYKDLGRPPESSRSSCELRGKSSFSEISAQFGQSHTLQIWSRSSSSTSPGVEGGLTAHPGLPSARAPLAQCSHNFPYPRVIFHPLTPHLAPWLCSPTCLSCIRS